MGDFFIHEFWRLVFLQQKVAEYASFNLEAVKAEIDAQIRPMKAGME